MGHIMETFFIAVRMNLGIPWNKDRVKCAKAWAIKGRPVFFLSLPAERV
jgi:hypothetical protein